MTLIEAAAKKYQANGLSLIPINQKTKRPASWLLPQAVTAEGEPLYWQQVGARWTQTTEDTGSPKRTWEPYQRERATLEDLDYWFTSGIKAIAIVAGAVSGGVEVLDFDANHGETWYSQWCALAGEPIERYGLAVQRTGGGGYQVAWRCDEIEANQKLAWAPAPDEASGKKVMIETRGEGGYFLVAPSVHPSGRHYELLHGRFSQIPRITPAERQHLLDCARQLNQVETPAPKRSGTDTTYTGSSANEVVDAFNRAHPITETLRRYGYTQHGDRWSRPGKADSLGVRVLSDGKAYAFSSNDMMAADRCGVGDNRPFDSFDMLAYRDHREDYKAATRAAAIELGMAYEATQLHTLLYVEGYANAAVTREVMFNHGWVARGFRPDKINLDGTGKYTNVIVWSYKDGLAKHVAGMIPGAYPLVVPNGLDAQAMAKDGILQPYLDAVLADARSKTSAPTWQEVTTADEPDDEQPLDEPMSITTERDESGRTVYHFCPNPHLLTGQRLPLPPDQWVTGIATLTQARQVQHSLSEQWVTACGRGVAGFYVASPSSGLTLLAQV